MVALDEGRRANQSGCVRICITPVARSGNTTIRWVPISERPMRTRALPRTVCPSRHDRASTSTSMDKRIRQASSRHCRYLRLVPERGRQTRRRDTRVALVESIGCVLLSDFGQETPRTRVQRLAEH